MFRIKKLRASVSPCSKLIFIRLYSEKKFTYLTIKTDVENPLVTICDDFLMKRFHPPNPALSYLNPPLSDKNLKISSFFSCYFIFPPYLCIDSAANRVSPLGITITF